MKYLSLELKGFTRMLLNNVKSFTIEPTEPIQLILGTNGSGKSSLLDALTPLPASQNDFATEGSKAIAIEHQGAVYDLKSVFSNGQKHYFYKNGEDLNPGGTITVQKELVKQHFNITSEIHTLTSGQSRFSTMSSIDRRYWFTKLSDTNYDYAISVYKRLKDRHRDVTGALKLAKNRLVTETAKTITNEEKANLKSQVDELYALCQKLIEYRMPVDKTSQSIEEKAKDLEKRIASLFTTLMKKKKTHPNGGLNLQETTERLLTIESIRQVEQVFIDKFFEEHNELTKTIQTLNETGGKGIDELQAQIDEISKQMNVKQSRKKLNLEFETGYDVETAFNTVYDNLTTVFSSLPENPNKLFNRVALQEASEKITSIKAGMVEMNSNLNKLTVQKDNQEHIKDHDTVDCPQCKHKWSRGFDQIFYDKVLENIEVVQENIDELTVRLMEAQEALDVITNYSDTFKQFSNCVNNWSILKPLWDKILKDELIYRAPRACLGMLEALRHDLTIDIEIEAFRKEYIRVNSIMVMASKLGDANIDKIKTQLEQLDEKMSISTQKIQDCNVESKKLTLYKKDMEDIVSISSDIELLVSSFTMCYHEAIESFRRDALNESIRTVQGVLNQKERVLYEMNLQAGIIKDIEQQITSLELQESAYKALMKQLSPVDGLIAEGLLGFISTFVKHMNVFIKRIWMYPLSVVPCGLSSEGVVELDYKFPLKISDREKPVPDVKQGSTAMKEVTDLAFQITAMKYLGLEDSPLILDEFGASLDAEHRVAAARAIQELMDMRDFTQLFIVSHYEATYGSLTNAQVCVLCSSNIVIPKNAIVNQHVTIE